MMISLVILVFTLLGKIIPAPLGKVKENTAVDLTSLTACEKNIQLNCINIHGTEVSLRGIDGGSCNISKLVDCMHFEKNKKECRVQDYGTVYYIEAFLRHIDVTKCMDDFDFYEVQHLFQFSSQKNVHEFSHAQRTLSSGDHGSFNYHPDDNEVGDDDDVNNGSGSGSA